MSKVNVINPTDSDITVTIEGHTYTVEAKGTVEAEEGHANYWKSKLHNFLLIEEIKEAKKEEKGQTEAEAKAAKKEVEEVEAALKAQAKKEKDAKKDK